MASAYKYDADLVIIENDSVVGSVLKPLTYKAFKNRIDNLPQYEVMIARYGKRLADIAFNNGHINGNLIAKSLTGNGESHLHLFNSKSSPSPSVPSTTSVPEPAALAGLILCGLGMTHMRRKQMA